MTDHVWKRTRIYQQLIKFSSAVYTCDQCELVINGYGTLEEIIQELKDKNDRLYDDDCDVSKNLVAIEYVHEL